MDTAAILNILVTANATQAQAALGKTQAQLAATGKTATATSATMKKAFLGVGIAAAAAGTALFKIGEEFDDAYDKIRTRTGATGKEMGKLKQSFRDVVSSVPADFDQAAEAVGGLNQRLDLSGKPLAKMSKQITELSRLTGTDVESNVRAVSRAFVDWEVKTKEQSKTLDGLFRLSQASGMAVADIAESVQKFGSPLRQLGFDLDESAAMFATFEKAGVNAQTMVPGFKLAISNLTRPTEVLAASMEKLGIKAGDPEKGLKQVFAILSDENRSQIEKTGLAMDVFGKRAGADMAEAVRQGRFEVDKFLNVMNKGGGTILETGRKTMDAAEHFQKFKNNVMLALEPLAKDVFKGLGNLMQDLTRAFKRGGATEAIDLLATKIEEAIPKIMEAGVKLGAKLAGAVIKGFVNAPFWVQLATGAFLLRGAIMKGFAALGRKIGARIAVGMAAYLGASKVGMMLANSLAIVGWGPVGTAMAVAMGVGMAAYFGTKVGPKLADVLQTSIKSEDIAGAAKFELKEGTFDSFISETRKAGNKITVEMVNTWKKAGLITDKQAERMKDAIERVRKDWTSGWEPVNDKTKEVGKKTGDNLQAGADKGKKAADDLHGHVTRTFKRTATETGQSTGKINKGTGADMEGARKKGSQGAARLGKSVSGTFANMAQATGRGMANIRDNLNSGLKSMKIGSLKWSIEKAQRSGGFKPQFEQQGGIIEAQRGMRMVAGFGSGDTVPAMLEPGEVVWNREAVKRMGGARKVNAINQAIPRFQEGGGLDFAYGPYAIPPIQYDELHAGSNSHWHISGSPSSWVVGIGKALQRMGFMVGEHPAFGGVSPVHAHYGPTDHYHGGAIDVNSAADETRAETARVAALLSGKGGIGTVVEKIARVMLKGPDGPLKDLGQKSIDRVWSAANKYLADKAPAETAGMSGSGDVEKVFAAVAKRLSTSKTATLALGEAGYAESGMRDLPGGMDSSQGSLQLLSSTASSMGIDPHDEAAVASAFLLRGYYGRGGANKLAAQGLPAHMVAQSVQGSAFSDGSNYLAQEGAAKNWMGRYGLQRGGVANFAEGGIVEWFKKRIPGLNIKDTDKRVEQQRHILKHLSKALSSKGIDADGLGKPLLDLRAMADEAGTNMSNAFDLRPQGPDGDILDKNGMPILGQFGTPPKTELEWLDKQIQHLWDLRNALIRYEKQVEQRLKDVERMVKLIDGKDGWKRKAEKVVKDLSKKGKTPKSYKGPDPNTTSPEKWNKLSDAKRKKHRNEFEKGGKLAGDRFFDDKDRLHVTDKSRARGFISSLTKIGGRLGGHKDNLSAGLVTLGDELNTVQGASAPKGPFDKPLLGVHGGELHSALIARKDLTTKPLDVTDSGVGSEAAEMLAELRAQEIQDLRTQLGISQAQYGVFANFPAFAKGGRMAQSGWAVVGEQGPELAQLPGGTNVYSNQQSQGMMPEPVVNNEIRVFVGNKEITDIVRVEQTRQLNEVGRAATSRGGVVGRKAG